MKDNRKTIQLLLIFTVIFSIMGGSLAYWNWNTTEGQKTNVVFTVTSDFSCAADGGGNITSNDVMLAPTTCTDTARAIKRKVTVTPTLNRETMTLSMDLWLTINDLGEGLKKSNNFRYVLTTSSNSCEEGTIMASGNFKGRKEGNKVNLLTNELYTETPTEPEEYYLYIWLDEEETSSSTMNQTFSLSLGGQCEEVETLVGDAYALLFENGTDTDWSGSEYSTYDLIFVRSETPITAGSEYDGKVVTEVYSEFETSTQASWYWYDYVVTNIEFQDTIRPISTASWFESTSSVEQSDLSKLDTSQVTDMSRMFVSSGVNDVESISNFDVSKVTNMSAMFQYYRTDGLDFSSWDVSNVTDMSGMFDSYYVSNLDLSNWDTSSVTDMSGMFNDSGMDKSSISNWNVSNVTDMSGMFQLGSIGSALDLSGWDTSSVTSMYSMFGSSYIYSNLSLSNWDVSNVRDMSSMFSGVTFHVDIDIDLSNWNVQNVTDYSWFSENLYGDGTIIPPVWRNAYLKIYSKTDNSLRIYSDLNVPSVGSIYDGRVVTKVYNMSAGTGSFSCSSSGVTPTSIVVEDNITPTSLSSWFSGCTKVNYVDVTKVDISNITSMYETFKNVGSDSSVTTFTIIGLNTWDTSKITGMGRMFYNMGLNADYTLDLSGWDVSKVTSHSDFDYGVANKIIDPLWK